MNIGIAGNVRRMDRRNGKLSAFTRAEVVAMIRSCGSVEELRRFVSDERPRVRRAAYTRALALEYAATHARVAEIGRESKSEFDLLVERFTAEGRPNPVASARASLAARAGAKKRQSVVA